MHKIKWNELWPKVVECCFKKTTSRQLISQAPLFNSHRELILLFFNIIFQYVFLRRLHLIF